MPNRSKLAVILHADVVSSTELVQQDERIAHERIQDTFQRFSRTIAAYSGTTHELRGDALVAEFERGSDAVSAALRFQIENQQHNDEIGGDIRPCLRAGIALAEVIIADQTITGAGVVLAQRLEQIAAPGGLCISAAVREALPSRLPFQYRPLGEQTLKGFDDPVRAFLVFLGNGASVPAPEPILEPGRIRGARWIVGALVLLVLAAGGLLGWLKPWQASGDRGTLGATAHAVADRPSVAVLPFKNASDNAEQDIFADGVTEDIITDLSKVSGLFVVARDAAFEYRGAAVNVRQVANDLGVRYVLEGSVRRSRQKIRITAQLVDALRGNHLWSERYDRDLNDVFAVQSEVAAHVVKALAVTLKSGEHERLFQKHTTSIEAYDVFIRARRTVDVPSRENIERGQELFERVIELDPGFAGGYAGLSFNYSVKARFGYGRSRADDSRRSLELAHEAIRVDPQFGWSHVAMGGAQLAAGDAPAAAQTMRQALALLPGDYEVHLFSGLYLQFAGESDEAVEHLEIARRMNPVDTDRNLAFLGMAYFMNKDYARAETLWTLRQQKFATGGPMPFVFLAATHALQGKSRQAAVVAGTLREAFPEFRLSQWQWSNTYHSAENRERLHSGARMAGVP